MNGGERRAAPRALRHIKNGLRKGGLLNNPPELERRPLLGLESRLRSGASRRWRRGSARAVVGAVGLARAKTSPRARLTGRRSAAERRRADCSQLTLPSATAAPYYPCRWPPRRRGGGPPAPYSVRAVAAVRAQLRASSRHCHRAAVSDAFEKARPFIGSQFQATPKIWCHSRHPLSVAAYY